MIILYLLIKNEIYTNIYIYKINIVNYYYFVHLRNAYEMTVVPRINKLL